MACAAGIATAAYTVEDTYNNINFFDTFSFFSGSDPTSGFVDYVTATVANSSALAGFSKDQIYLGVDHTTANPTGGRASTRVSSNKAYTHGLFIADIAHMPGGICGVWPAFWTFGPNWPSSGEIDIIEGVNAQSTDSITLHTSSGCTMSNAGSASGSTMPQGDCNTGNGNTGCSQSTSTTNAYGNEFNAIGGGVYAMDWTSDSIAVYFFPRTSIPADITAGTPAPQNWGAPVAKFAGSSCDIDAHFMNHNIVFDTTFCGDWAGNAWASSTCASLANTCDEYVGANPAAFVEAYWLINSVKVYSDPSASKRDAPETPPLVARSFTA
ncbi:MAG: hypothetical protein M1818_008178 [Claussenomyces sp. TS43310]|nr:MAG: hypothetical protein M1818_008178 [Claussenomyces sp. TS43310]